VTLYSDTASYHGPVTPWLLLLACDTDTTLGETGTQPPQPAFAGIESVAWDGGDGLVASWTDGVEVGQYTVRAVDAAGNTVTQFSETAASHLTGLADGVYTISVEASADDGEAYGGDVVLTQLVGENRLVPLSQIAHPGFQDLWGEGDVVVAAGGRNQDADLIVVDASDPTAPMVVAQHEGVREIRDVHLEDGVVYAASDNSPAGVGVWILDLSDPADPVELARVPGAVHNLHYGDGHLYLADLDAEAVTILDVADPSDPAWVAEWPLTLGVHDVTWVDGLLYVASPGGLAILDVTEPSDPVLVLEHTLMPGNPADGFHNVWPSSDGTHLFTTHEAIGGAIKTWRFPYDVLEEVSAWPEDEPNCAHNVHVRGDHAFAAWYLEGVRVLDVSDPAAPVLIGSYDTFDETAQRSGEFPDIRGAWGVWPYGEQVVVSDTETGLWWFDFYPVTVTADAR